MREQHVFRRSGIFAYDNYWVLHIQSYSSGICLDSQAEADGDQFPMAAEWSKNFDTRNKQSTKNVNSHPNILSKQQIRIRLNSPLIRVIIHMEWNNNIATDPSNPICFLNSSRHALQMVLCCTLGGIRNHQSQ